MLTAFFRREYAVVEDLDEPLERVLIHRVDKLQVGETKEQDPSANRDRYVQRPGYIDVRLGNFSFFHFHLHVMKVNRLSVIRDWKNSLIDFSASLSLKQQEQFVLKKRFVAFIPE